MSSSVTRRILNIIKALAGVRRKSAEIMKKIIPDKGSDIIRKTWGRYLRDEEKYDVWGNMGKLLVILEVLSEEGFDIAYLIRMKVDFEKLVNMVFPRSFHLHADQKTARLLASEITDYFLELNGKYRRQGMDASTVEVTAADEVMGKFGITSDQLKHILAR